MEELVITKKTNLNKIINKDKYDKLVLNCKINPKKLVDFKNIKELTIDYLDRGEYNYNEQTLNLLSFKNNLKKITFKQIRKYGVLKKTTTKSEYNILENMPNLKSIEFPSCINDIHYNYLNNISSLEEILFNVSNINELYGNIYTSSPNLKRLVIKFYDKDYIINLDYKIIAITGISYDSETREIYIGYESDETESIVTIKRKTDEIIINNGWTGHVKNSIAYIPDYINGLNCYLSEKIRILSLNLNLFNNMEHYKTFIHDIDSLETIILRSNNEMQLIPKIEIKVKEYGELNDIYFESNLLYLEYDNFTVTINSKGEVNKIVREIEKIEEKQELDLKKYTLEELEEYICYLKLLKISNNQEYIEAMNIVEKELIKKLTK